MTSIAPFSAFLRAKEKLEKVLDQDLVDKIWK